MNTAKLAIRASTVALVSLAAPVSRGDASTVQDGLPLLGAIPAGYDRTVDSDRVMVLTRDPVVSDSALSAYAATLDGTAVAVRELLGADRVPDVRLVVVLDGSGRGSSAPVPHVDRQGRVFLYRYVPGGRDYLSSAAHELVHAYRRAARTPYLGFVEEGLAQAVTLAVAPERQGFPRYGFPIAVAAGHLIARGDAPAMATVLEQNRAFLEACAATSYVLREAFFAYLTERTSLDRVIDFTWDTRPGPAPRWEAWFGAPLDSLDAAWRAGLLAEFEADPANEAAADRYRTESPVRDQRFCSGAAPLPA